MHVTKLVISKPKPYLNIVNYVEKMAPSGCSVGFEIMTKLITPIPLKTGGNRVT